MSGPYEYSQRLEVVQYGLSYIMTLDEIVYKLENNDTYILIKEF